MSLNKFNNNEKNKSKLLKIIAYIESPNPTVLEIVSS